MHYVYSDTVQLMYCIPRTACRRLKGRLGPDLAEPQRAEQARGEPSRGGRSWADSHGAYGGAGAGVGAGLGTGIGIGISARVGTIMARHRV